LKDIPTGGGEESFEVFVEYRHEKENFVHAEGGYLDFEARRACENVISCECPAALRTREEKEWTCRINGRAG